MFTKILPKRVNGQQSYQNLVTNPYHGISHVTMPKKGVDYVENGEKWKQFYESMDPTASGAELEEFWRKQSEMKQKYGTNDSYHQGTISLNVFHGNFVEIFKISVKLTKKTKNTKPGAKNGETFTNL